MSNQIYYDRAFIRVGDKFVPMVNSGSNNYWEYVRGRDVAEKNWGVINWDCRYKLLYSEEEIREIARESDVCNQQSGMMFKSRSRCFESGEFERWIINGMRNAYTVEEYVSFGNVLYVLDHTTQKIEDWTMYYFKTTEELLKIIESLGSAMSVDVCMLNNREVYRPKLHRAPREKLSVDSLSEYFVLKGEAKGSTIYFVKLTRNGYEYTAHFPSGYIKPFLTEKEALRYLEKYSERLRFKVKFAPERIVNAS